MQKQVVEHETHQPQEGGRSYREAERQQRLQAERLRLEQVEQRRGREVHRGVEKVVDDHGLPRVLPFDVEEGEHEDDPDDPAVQELQAPGRAEVGPQQVGPGGGQQPGDGEADCGVAAQQEEEAVAEDVGGDGAHLVEEVDGRGQAPGHLPGVRQGDAQAAAVVHQGPSDVQEGEGDG